MNPQSHDVCTVEIGGIPIRLRGDNPDFRCTIQQRYERFLTTSSAEFELEFELLTSAPKLAKDPTAHREGDEWVFDRGDFSARFNPLTGRGVVQQYPNPYALDSLLRMVHSLIVASRGGFLLHAASAICDGRACLFSGVSGAGKTTLTRLAPPDVTRLTDEISYVRPIAGAYYAWGTPFAGELAQPGENCSAPIAALFFLEKGPHNRVEEVSESEAMRRLLRNILFFAKDRDLVDTILATACDFLSRTPVRKLIFYPDARAWDAVRQFVGEPLHA